jgi:hypothetical protein
LFVNEGQPKSITQAMLADDVVIGGSGTWTRNGEDQYSAVSGNVGIGTDNPTSKLTVNGTVDVSGNVITGLAAPVNASDATNKQYVDAASGSGTYKACYVINTNATGKTCRAGYTTIASNNAQGGWSFDSSVMGDDSVPIVYLTVGGQLLTVQFDSSSSWVCPPPDIMEYSCTSYLTPEKTSWAFDTSNSSSCNYVIEVGGFGGYAPCDATHYPQYYLRMYINDKTFTSSPVARYGVTDATWAPCKIERYSITTPKPSFALCCG